MGVAMTHAEVKALEISGVSAGRDNPCFLSSFAVSFAPFLTVRGSDADATLGYGIADCTCMSLSVWEYLIGIFHMQALELFYQFVVVSVHIRGAACIIEKNDGFAFCRCELHYWLSLLKSSAYRVFLPSSLMVRTAS